MKNNQPKFRVGQVVMHKSYYGHWRAYKIIRVCGTWNMPGQQPVFEYSLRRPGSDNGYIDVTENRLQEPTEEELKNAIKELQR